MQPQYFTPGPSELYFTVPDHLRSALKEGVCSISHRSKAFEAIYAHAEAGVRALLDVPEGYHVVFTASATEVWERIIQNCAGEETFHLVNGSFSKRFYEFAALLGRRSGKAEMPFGQGFDGTQEVPGSAELLCCTLNETSSGVAMPPESIYALRRRCPEALIAVDAVSAVPYVALDLRQVDSLFFSVQKGMGLPAGLGVWIFNERCAEKARQLEASGRSIGTYHSIPALLEKAASRQTPETPNTLGIYLLGKVCEDMLRKGLKAIRQEMLYKATIFYKLFEAHPRLSALVADPAYRSHTVAVANVSERTPAELIAYLSGHGLVVGSGYGKYKATQVRIANFPTHSKESAERICDLLEAWG